MPTRNAYREGLWVLGVFALWLLTDLPGGVVVAVAFLTLALIPD